MSISSDFQAEVSPVVGRSRTYASDYRRHYCGRGKLQADAARLFSSFDDNFDITLLLEGREG